MAVKGREGRLVEAFVTLADSLVADYDIVDLLHTLVDRCADLLEAVDAAIILADGRGGLGVMAATSERSREVSVLQLTDGDGPCVEAYRTGDVVSADDVALTGDRWPRFTAVASSMGYASVHAIPLRLRDTTIGSLNLFRDRPGGLDPDDARAAQALADVATIGILQERSIREADVARQQLQHALDSRVAIEQAKGVVGQKRGVDMDEAFRLIRARARADAVALAVLAQAVVAGSVTI